MTVKEEDAEFMRMLRVGKDATDQDRQEALNWVFRWKDAAIGLPEDTENYKYILLGDEVGEDS